MKKKVFTWRSQLCMVHYALCILMLSGLSMSCSDDDNDKDGRTAEEIAQDPYEKESEAADALYRLACQLSVCDSLPNDWKTATFEPAIGHVLDASQPRVRTITVANAAEAVTRYNSLTGKTLPLTATSDTYKVDGVGTLTLNVGAAGTIATIDVDVKQMPQLAQLRMVAAGSIGENGTFRGEPYYRFGDVVLDKEGCYWICVRPAYSPDSKEDTHWMSFQVTNDNIKTYTKSKCQQQKYPVNLGVQKEKMQYLAQLLAIMAKPEDYKADADKYQGKYFNGHSTGLGGLKVAAMPVDTLVVQAKLWEKYDVWQKVMPIGYDADEWQRFRERFTKEVSFVYEKGSTSGKQLYIPYVTYTGASLFYTNEPTYSTATVNMEHMAFDIMDRYTIRGLMNSARNYPVPDAFVVRYKTGKQLSSNWFFNPSPTETLPGVTDVFRYNAHRTEDVFGNNDASTWNKTDYDGDPHYHIGDVYKDENGHRWIVMRMAGGLDDNAPFTELVSFDGLLTASGDNARFTNIPTRMQALRTLLPLLFVSKQCSMIYDNDVETQTSANARITRHILDFANVDVRRLFQIVAKIGIARDQTLLACIPYLDNSSSKQKLIRVIQESGNERKDHNFWLWEHYPETPSATEQWQKKFSTDYICLQDVADQTSVTKWAEDVYARQPLSKFSGGDEVTKREPRKDATSLALSVTNYLYNRNIWQNYQYCTDMWNEPLVCYRATAVYDRGLDHATITVDGHQLTLVHAQPIYQDENDYDLTIRYGSTLDSLIGWLNNMAALFIGDDMLHLDGKSIKQPTWRETWL